MDRQKIQDAFDSYVNGFDLNNPKIRLKYEHTYHVAENCEEIAKDVFGKEAAAFAGDSRLAGETAEDTAWLIGMLHDIGRFEQLKRYDTFNDRLFDYPFTNPETRKALQQLREHMTAFLTDI